MRVGQAFHLLENDIAMSHLLVPIPVGCPARQDGALVGRALRAGAAKRVSGVDPGPVLGAVVDIARLGSLVPIRLDQLRKTRCKRILKVELGSALLGCRSRIEGSSGENLRLLI